MNETKVWTEARITRLKELAAQDYSYSEIADLMGFDVTRSGIAGACARFGIAVRRSRNLDRKFTYAAGKRKARSRGFVASRAGLTSPPKSTTAAGVNELARLIPMIRIAPNECRWIIGEPRNGICCGRETHGHRSYCPDHRDIATKSNTKSVDTL